MQPDQQKHRSKRMEQLFTRRDGGLRTWGRFPLGPAGGSRP